MIKTVVELDLVGYSTICDNLEQGLDVNTVAQLNQQIQSFIDAGLEAVRARRDQAVMLTAGDSAIVVFDSAREAHQFAEAVQEATREHNRTRNQPLAKRVFRIGAATGDIVMQPKPGGGYDIAGMTIARAVRLEAKAPPGGLLVDEATYQALSADQQRRHGSKARVAGKRDEEFDAYPCQLNPDGPNDAAFFTDQAKKGDAPVPEQRIASSRLRHIADKLIGREDELQRLTKAWSDPAINVVTIVAWGGVGKTSLVAHWQAGLVPRHYDGANYFDWSFYSQGTREQGGASADTFIAAALEFFGGEEGKKLASSPVSPWDKGAKLAQWVGQRRSLLVLDGIEPLQYPPGPLAGQLKDRALEALLKGLAQKNVGLCLVNTREPVTDLAPYRDKTVQELELEHLSEQAGAALLHHAGATRAGAGMIRPEDPELRAASGEVNGHALTLSLLGSYLAKAHGGDIRRRHEVKFEKADASIQGGHAFKTMAAYENWLAGAGVDGQRQLAALRLLGLFDRPADARCLEALRRAPAIPGLTEPLVGLGQADWNVTLSFLADCGLVSVQKPGSSQPSTLNSQPWLDAHPLIREYFAKALREQQPDAWREGHRRLYEHLKASVPHWPEGLAGVHPLYQAVAHGCHAGLHQQACVEVYRDRILRGTGAAGFYSTRKLGAFGADLGAVACFFEEPWTRLASALSEADQAWLLNEAATRLHALGRLGEALEPMRVSGEMDVQRKQWKGAAISYGNLSDLELTLGQLPAALRDAEQSVAFADRAADAFVRMVCRTALADAVHQAGRQAEALALFREAEAMQAQRELGNPLLYSLRGFQYCDLLLAEAERAAWQCSAGVSPAGLPGVPPGGSGGETPPEPAAGTAALLQSCRAVEQRAAQTLKWEEEKNWLLDIALDHLTLGRAALYEAILENSSLATCRSSLAAAMDGLRAAGQQDYLPRGLLTRAWSSLVEAAEHRRRGENPKAADCEASARADLDEAQQIAERGSMRLHLADIHLHRARLFRDKEELKKARALIEQCGYWRRKEELEDAERVIGV
jgi:class 3 adenylate cyclase